MAQTKTTRRSSSNRWLSRAKRLREFLSDAQPRRFRRLGLEQLERREVLTLTLSIQATDATMTEPLYYVNTNPAINPPQSISPMDVPDKGVFTVTRSGYDPNYPLENPFQVPFRVIGDYAHGWGLGSESDDGYVWADNMFEEPYPIDAYWLVIPAGQSSASPAIAYIPASRTAA